MAQSSLDALLEWFLAQSRADSPEFFESEAVKEKRKRNVHDNPLHVQLSELISAPAFDSGMEPQFHILEAQQIAGVESKKLELIGHYELFDGVRVDVAFSGVYGAPKQERRETDLRPEEAFSSFTLEARLHNADGRQKAVFSAIRLSDSHNDDFRFRDGMLRYSKPRGRDWLGNENVAAGLVRIAHLGVIAALYEALHERAVLNAVAQKHGKFLESLVAIGEKPQNVEFTVEEAFYINKGYGKFFPFVRFAASREGNVQGIVLARSTAKPLFAVTFSYNTQLAREDECWNVKVEGQLMNMLQVVAYAHYKDLKLPSPVEKTVATINFVKGALGFTVYDPKDSVGGGYKNIFDDCLLNAREEVKSVHPDYEPLVLTFGESNLHVVHDDLGFGKKNETFEFRTLSSYHVFDALIALVRSNPLIEVKALISNDEVQKRLDHDPTLKRRFMTYSECYAQNPVRPWQLFNARDPAFVRAKELEEQYHSRERGKS